MVNKYINAQYQEIYDLATSPNKVTIMGIRTPSGSVPSIMLAGFWQQFKSVKYNGADIVMRATARQPVDPLQVGVSAGSKMDMRDLQNPILFRGCHGESLGNILNQLMGLDEANHTFSGDSLDIDETNLSNVENFYYQCLTDMSWKKSMPENGFAFNGLHPLVYNLASNFQLVHDGHGVEKLGNDYFQQDQGLPVFEGAGTQADPYTAHTNLPAAINGGAGRRIFTSDLQPLGWLDTENRFGGSETDKCPKARIPRCYMGILMLPPAYTEGVQQFFRIVITHYFTFKDFRSISLDSDYSDTPGYYDTINTNGEVVLTSAKVR